MFKSYFELLTKTEVLIRAIKLCFIFRLLLLLSQCCLNQIYKIVTAVINIVNLISLNLINIGFEFMDMNSLWLGITVIFRLNIKYINLFISLGSAIYI